MNRLAFNAFIPAKVPIAWIAGVKLQYLDDRSCRTAVRYGWLNRNPFNSLSWAVEGMAAEFSTGALCVARLRKSERRISLLLVGLEANFSKKAVGRIVFRCDDGEAVDAVLRDVVADSVPRTLRMRSIGTDEQGDRVGEFFFTWSFKAKG
ncbi:thioesterase [Burkholderia plantarii]|uniref:thioesterase n=1 Tax=Burkholderia plantarii TaxID=41899 RepID=UPI0018DD1836|nr:thioesterase [Burkholderia plantarii]MBI0325540.1 thioesterase [Burkholderia plantarii]